MPLVAHTNLPTFTRLEEEGHEVLSCDRASHQDIRELHIGLLNMMPDAALKATELQFLRLIGESNPIAQFFVHSFWRSCPDSVFGLFFYSFSFLSLPPESDRRNR